jgi:hypothetical protein|tara:strand:+ start:669 stop:1289 length:621 start_codon:yes stop_codon:yes gene_type:complete
MGFLKKIRTSLLNQDNSFHVGFQNRNPIGGTSRKSSSPLNYASKYSGDWTPTVQSLEQNPAGWIDPNMGGEWSKATTAAIKAVGDIGTAVVKSQTDPKKCEEGGGTWVNGKCESGGTPPKPTPDPMQPKPDTKKNPVGTEKGQVKPGSFAHKTVDPEGYDSWIKGQELLKKEKEEEKKEKERQRALNAAGVPDFTNITGTSDDWHY